AAARNAALPHLRAAVGVEAQKRALRAVAAGCLHEQAIAPHDWAGVPAARQGRLPAHAFLGAELDGDILVVRHALAVVAAEAVPVVGTNAGYGKTQADPQTKYEGRFSASRHGNSSIQGDVFSAME